MGHPHAAVAAPHATSVHGSHAHSGHHGSHGGKDHVPHVLPLWVYFATWGTLMVLTAITVAVSYVDVGALNIVIALLIATLKASTVALLFMHLWFDHKFHILILLSSVVFLAIFIAFTMFDTEVRGRGDAMRSDRPTDLTNPFGGRRSEVAIRAASRGVPLPSNWLPPGRGETAPAPAASVSGMPPAGIVAGGQGSAMVTAASAAAVGSNAPGGTTLGVAAAQASASASAGASASPAAASAAPSPAPSGVASAAPSSSAAHAPHAPHH